ncbi:sensor histidine kinase [Nonomuraea sp. NPDC050691]|uniref:sensor histidine kinase n=1 Tax=Nonomuraea sp. NPDC050691 TaxID=3155661 RepID=UPI0033EB135C
MARELHDSLTHSISIIKVQAGVAVHLARKRGEEVPEALLAIQEASREAMRELRATLEVLRDSADDPPATGLDRLDDLVGRARSAGLPTSVTIEGDRRPLPAEADRAAYRIVQEALTNIARHAGPASASVRIRYGDETLLVQVDDDGRASLTKTPVPGVGLRGMHERVTALGGHLRAEPRPSGGFTVQAELPLAGSSALTPSSPAAHPLPEASQRLTPSEDPERSQAPAAAEALKDTKTSGQLEEPERPEKPEKPEKPEGPPSDALSDRTPGKTSDRTSTRTSGKTSDRTPDRTSGKTRGKTSTETSAGTRMMTSTMPSDMTSDKTSTKPSTKTSDMTSTGPSDMPSENPSARASDKSATEPADQPSARPSSGEEPKPVVPLGHTS